MITGTSNDVAGAECRTLDEESGYNLSCCSSGPLGNILLFVHGLLHEEICCFNWQRLLHYLCMTPVNVAIVYSLAWRKRMYPIQTRWVGWKQPKPSTAHFETLTGVTQQGKTQKS